jgi:glycosyl hydrolase family 59 (putative galactocerebrosidase)
MRLRFWLFPLFALLSTVALAGCGANPPAQAQPATQGGVVLPTPPPMPTSQPQPPTPTPPPAPAAVAPAAGTTLLAADFGSTTDLKQWTVIDAADALPGPSVWKLQDGRLIPYSDAQDLPSMYSTALVTGDPSWSDYSVSVAGYVTVNDELGVVARASEAGYYVFKLLPAAQQPSLVLARYDAAKGVFTPLATAATGGFKQQTWYTLKLQVQGEQLTAYVDGQEVLKARDATLKSGRAGVAAYAEGGLEFDNFSVQALAPGSQP